MDVQEYVANLYSDQQTQIIDDWMTFQRDGVIGDCLLQRLAQEYMELIETNQTVTWWMREIAFAVSLELAYRYMDLLD